MFLMLNHRSSFSDTEWKYPGASVRLRIRSSALGSWVRMLRRRKWISFSRSSRRVWRASVTSRNCNHTYVRESTYNISSEFDSNLLSRPFNLHFSSMSKIIIINLDQQRGCAFLLQQQSIAGKTQAYRRRPEFGILFITVQK